MYSISQPTSTDPSCDPTTLWRLGCYSTTALVATIISIYTTYSLRSAKESIAHLRNELERLSGRSGLTNDDIELANRPSTNQ